MPETVEQVNEQEEAPEVEAAPETVDEVPDTVEEVNEQEEAPEVEAWYPGGLAGPVQPDFLIPEEGSSLIPPEPCNNCGALDCDCDELRDRRGEIRDLAYDLRIEERDAKQRVRDIRA